MESNNGSLTYNLPLAKKAALSEPVNHKLGHGIHGWSIPAIHTCPGRSHLCSSRCYATKSFFTFPGPASSHARNYEFSQTPQFVDWMVQSLAAQWVRVLRCHVAGDFYDVAYTRKWSEIARRASRVQIFAYTRSWRCDDILPELLNLAQCPNVMLWWSIDRETGPAPLVQGVRRAYMAIDDADAQCAPDDCDLVFRDSTKTILKKANGVLVCPPENGVTRGVTCTKCGVCWSQQRRPIWEAALLSSIRSEEILVA